LAFHNTPISYYFYSSPIPSEMLHPRWLSENQFRQRCCTMGAIGSITQLTRNTNRHSQLGEFQV
jgi:hypothetical protein